MSVHSHRKPRPVRHTHPFTDKDLHQTTSAQNYGMYCQLYGGEDNADMILREKAYAAQHRGRPDPVDKE